VGNGFKETSHNRINREVYGENHDSIDWSAVGGKKPVTEEKPIAPAVEPKKKKTKWLVEEVPITEVDFDEFIAASNKVRMAMMEKGFTKFSIELVQFSDFAEDGGFIAVVSKKEK
jgi:hypothetical protein